MDDRQSLIENRGAALIVSPGANLCVAKPQKERQMNVRSVINKGKRRISLVAYLGVALFFVGILLSPIDQ